MAAVDEILAATSLYSVLGVDPADLSESSAGLRRAYLRRSMQVHPDKSPHANATQAFQRVAEAYDVLSDPSKKAEYDVSTGRGSRRRRPGAGSGGAGVDVVVVEVPLEQAFEMFSSAMDQYAQEQGIEHTRQTTVFDRVASALLFVDGWINPEARRAAARQKEERDAEPREQEVPRGAPPPPPRSPTPPSPPQDDAQPERQDNNASRLQTWARNLRAIGSIASTAGQIVRAQRERERAQQEAARNGGPAQRPGTNPVWDEYANSNANGNAGNATSARTSAARAAASQQGPGGAAGSRRSAPNVDNDFPPGFSTDK